MKKNTRKLTFLLLFLAKTALCLLCALFLLGTLAYGCEDYLLNRDNGVLVLCLFLLTFWLSCFLFFCPLPRRRLFSRGFCALLFICWLLLLWRIAAVYMEDSFRFCVSALFAAVFPPALVICRICRRFFQSGGGLRIYAISSALFCLTAIGNLLLFSWLDMAPRRDAEGYYLLCTRQGFTWFISRVQDGQEDLNARLTADLLLNDTSDWENWDQAPPEHSYRPMVHYSGHFDGGGFALEGYYSRLQTPVFTILDEPALITDLCIRKSLFQTTYEESFYLDDDGEIQVVPASALCFSNAGSIRGCRVQAKVLGAWSAGGIVGVNYGEMSDCVFEGQLEAGMDWKEDIGEDRWGVESLFAGGICRSNSGQITSCINEGSILLCSITDEAYMNYAAGGIAGTVSREGSIRFSKNQGTVESVQLAGGIAGANTGRILQCTNSGSVHVEQADLGRTCSLVTAGICASNGGLVDSCLSTGEVTIHQQWLSFVAPVYGIACNLINPCDGTTRNSYYLTGSAGQAYRQSGVYKVSAAELAALNPKMRDTDTWEPFSSLPDIPGTDEEDFIHLSMGPARDEDYTVLPGDTLWDIAARYYGDGSYYPCLIRQSGRTQQAPLLPGEHILIPCQNYYLLCPNDEEGFGWSCCTDASGSTFPTRFLSAKPADWYYGNMSFEANAWLDTMWPKEKDRETRPEVPTAGVRILFSIDGNPNGDFFAGFHAAGCSADTAYDSVAASPLPEDTANQTIYENGDTLSGWPAVRQAIRQSAEELCGKKVDCLRFYQYRLDNGENLYGYSFRLLRRGGTLNCAVFYRLRDGLLAEFIGIEPQGEDWNVLERVRYLAARLDGDFVIEDMERAPEDFYGREGWPFPLLHNPFAIAGQYNAQAECSPYMLWTGAQ